MTIVELQVNIDCAGCEDKVRKALIRLEGVHHVEIDRVRDKVTVTGSVDQKKVLTTVRRTRRTAVLWPYPYNPEYHTYAQVSYYQTKPALSHTQYYYNQHKPATSVRRPMMHPIKANSYNYHVHGYHDSHLYGYYREPAFSDVVSYTTPGHFSDDNPNACSIM